MGEKPRGDSTESKPDSYYSGSRVHLLDFLVQHRQPGGRALDVGCGAGMLGAGLLARGFMEVVGIEPVASAADAARGLLTEVHVGTFEEIDTGLLGAFDLIVFADSIEHMVDPWAALKAARGLLKDGGAVLLSVPNIGHWTIVAALLWDGVWRYEAEGLLDNTHLRFFTPETLRDTLSQVGMKVAGEGGAFTAWRRMLLSGVGLLVLPFTLHNPDLLRYQTYVLAEKESQ